MFWDWLHNRLGANPLEFVQRTTGMLTLIFLLLGLTITPLRKLTGFNLLIQVRRMTGLYAFFYGALHLLTYVWFDKFFALQEMVADTFSRPFILVGMFSFLLMVPLAVTSTNKMIKRLGGKRWSRLHKAVYAVAIGGVLHYYLIVKADTSLPLAFAFVLALLLGYRLLVNHLDEGKAKPLSIAPQSRR
ncbi:MAG: sulfoxide reductase heme-binding subunit YedZ [Pyrinomonadaceae bacterium]|nr:sulfoxide reductase heme-binding subunit YedZ [Pyrinomonadaceae bacterium]